MYDQNNRLTEFSRSHNTSYDVLCQLYTYDDLGRFTGYTTQENFGNIVTTTLGYKAPKSSMGTTATTVLSQWINNYGNTTSGYYYQIDGNGNITEISPDNNFADSNGVEYSYDSLDQLIRVDWTAAKICNTPCDTIWVE